MHASGETPVPTVTLKPELIVRESSKVVSGTR
jgi:hypothetical protein